MAATLIAGAGTLHAQMVGCNSFLKGTHVEVGISPIGAFGSSVPQPAGYHGNVTAYIPYSPCDTTSGVKLGFVADPDMDGWAVGTPPFYGDYFLPGSPYEGFSIQVNGTRADAFNTNSGFTGTLTGTNVSDTLVGSTWVALWQGNMDSLQITQKVTLDTVNLYFRVDVTLTNTGVMPLNNIYYMRSVDPDNAEMEAGGGFPTNNYIIGQHPDTSFSLVTATDPTLTAAYLGMGSTDTNSRVFIFNSWPLGTTVDISTIYDETISGTYYFAQGTAELNLDIAIGMIFSVPHLAGVDSASDSTAGKITSGGLHPANSKTLSYFYSFSPTATDSAISSSGGTISTAVKNVNAATIKVYPNPVRNAVYVSGLEATDRIRIADMMGNVFEIPQTGFSGGTGAFSIAGLTTGHYLLVVTDAAGAVKARMPIEKN